MAHSRLTLEGPEAELVKTLWLGNLATLAVMTAGAFIFAPWHTALSVTIGGAIALINFRILERSICRALAPAAGRPRGRGIMGRALAKYYLRFAITALVIFVLIRQGWVEPLGLLAGLSVVVVSIFAWGAVKARKLLKEAV